MFVGALPVVSESFILRQITGLLDLGHEVHKYANLRPEPDAPLHAKVKQYHLLERTTYMDAPPESGEFEMPAWPPAGRTWPPGSGTSIHNSIRLARALPKFLRCLATAPGLTFETLRPREYGYQAASLS